MSNLDRAADVLRTARAGRITLSPEASARALADDGLLAADPRIIRTRDELAALDPDTLLGVTDGSTYVAWEAQKYPGDLDLYAEDLPAVVIREGDEYRAAMQALREA